MRLHAALVMLSLALALPARAHGDGALARDGGAAPSDGGRIASDGGLNTTDGGAPASPATSFDLFDGDKKTPPLDPTRLAHVQRQVQLRRRLLTWHRALGFATLAALALTNILGTLDYYDKYDARGTDNGQFATWHEGVSIGTTAAFAATGILALVTPNPHPQPRKLDARLLHKIAMALAAAGFVAQIVLGPITTISEGKLYQRDLALSHVVLGWGTFAFMGAGVLAYVF